MIQLENNPAHPAYTIFPLTARTRHLHKTTRKTWKEETVRPRNNSRKCRARACARNSSPTRRWSLREIEVRVEKFRARRYTAYTGLALYKHAHAHVHALGRSPTRRRRRSRRGTSVEDLPSGPSAGPGTPPLRHISKELGPVWKLGRPAGWPAVWP